MSQRDKNFKGGIQKGTVATDAVAKELDEQCKKIAESIEIKGLRMQTRLKKSQIPGGLAGCEPDGGAWFLGDKLVAVFEGKKQGEKGNAIERWFKNNYIARSINSDVCYITFCVGAGAAENKVLMKTLSIAHLNGDEELNVNKFVPKYNSAYFSVDGFSEEFISNKMHEVLEYCVENN